MPRDKETTDTMNRDTRTNGFIRKYGRLYAVELDALLAIIPDEFRTMIEESIDGFFDQVTYQEILAENQPEMVDRLVHEKVRFLDERG